MSTKVNKSTTVEPPVAGTTVIGGATAIPNTAAAPIGATSSGKVLSLNDILLGMKSCSKLDSAALNYVDEINRIFADGNQHITSFPVSTDKIEARCFMDETTKTAVNILFAETHQSLDLTPPAARSKEVMDAAIAIKNEAKVVQSIVVNKDDYGLAGNMAAFLSNAFKTVGSGAAANLSAANFKNVKISAITNIEMVRSYIRQISPHATPSRDDIGVLLCIEVPTQNVINGRIENEQKPFMALTGYTRVMNPQDANTGIKFVPIPTITDIVTSIPNPNLLAMALPLAADAFIVQALWTRPYTTFRSGMPNLGNLIQDAASKKPLFVDSNEAFHTFIRTYMTNPYLAIDITEGRARALGIDALIGNPAGVMNNIKNFFGADAAIDLTSRNPILMMFQNYTGTYLDKGVVKDTRCVDYLEMASKFTDHKQISHLLLQPNQPQMRIEAVRGIFPDATKSLYITTTVILDAFAISNMAQAVGAAGIAPQYDMPSSGNYQINFLGIQGANAFTGFSQGNMGFGRSNMAGFANIYSSLY